MESKQELEKKLREINEKEEKQRQDDWLNSEIKQHVGKCYSSHLFQKLPKPGITIRIRKIISCTWDKGNNSPIFEVEDISFCRYKQYNKMNFSIEKHSSSEAFPSWMGSWSYEISCDLFDNITEEITAHAEGYFDKIKHLFKQTEYISIGDNNDENNKLSLLEGFDFIELDMEGYFNINDLLVWNNHPFHYGRNKLLNTKESIEIVNKIANKLEENVRNWSYSSSIAERDVPRIKKLRSFYNKYKHN